MLVAWCSFWLSYMIFGMLFYNQSNAKLLPNHHINPQNIFNTIGLNAILSFLFIPIINLFPVLITVSDSIYGYILRVFLSLAIGEFIFYWSHRLLHTSYFYKYHKQHHLYTVPHSFAGLYASPVEYLISNHFSMVFPLKVISNPYPFMLIIESIAVSLNILKSHHSKVSLLTGSKSHLLHHEKMNCNYGFSRIVDWLFGTYQ